MFALLLPLGVGLVALAAWCGAGWMGLGSVAERLLAAYVIAFSEIVFVILALSPGRWVTWWSLLCVTGVICVLVLGMSRYRRRGLQLEPRGMPAIRHVLGDPVLLVLTTAVSAASTYRVALAVFTPQNADDALYYHLVRAALWKQHHGLAYLSGPFDGRVNGTAPNAEISQLFTMVLGSSDRYVGLVQFLAYVGLTLATYCLARRLGLTAREAVFGALVLATLPIIQLQSSAALNDVVLASFIAAGAVFLMSPSPFGPLLAGVAIGLGIGTKLPSILSLPLLAVLASMSTAGRRGFKLATVGLVSAAVGSCWYVVNLVNFGKLDGGVGASESGLLPDRSALPTLARLDRLGIDTLDLAGGSGRDRYLYAIAALALVAGAVLGLLRHRTVRARTLLLAGAVTAAVVATPNARTVLDRAHVKFWRAMGRADLAAITGHDLTQAATLASWYGPLLVILGVPSLAVCWRRYHHGDLALRAVLMTLAPIYGLVVIAVAIAYQDLSGRFLMPEIGLAAAGWAVAYRLRALAWAAAAIACTTLLLTSVNDAERPAGLPLLEPAPRSVWSEPRWRTQTIQTEPVLGPTLAYFDAHVPTHATVALATTPSDELYPFFGPGLHRTILFPARNGEIPASAGWLVIRPGVALKLEAGSWQTLFDQAGWRVLRRIPAS